MSDYTKATDFAAKDALPTGDAGKVATGTSVDDEFNALAIAINTKFDITDKNVANGLAPLDANILLPSANMPLATTTKVGGIETATSAEATARTAINKILVPSVFNSAANAWGGDNAGIVLDLQALADPAADVVFGWDNTSNSAKSHTAGAGIVISGGVLSANHDAATGFVANEHINHTAVSMTAGIGLTGGGTIAGTRNFDLDISTLTSLGGATIAGADSLSMYDSSASAMRRVRYQDFGIPVTTTASVTPLSGIVLADANRAYNLTAAAAVAFVIPSNASVAFPIGTVLIAHQNGAGTVTVTVTTDTLRQPTGNTTAQQYSTVAALKIAATEWVLTGDAA